MPRTTTLRMVLIRMLKEPHNLNHTGLMLVHTQLIHTKLGRDRVLQMLLHGSIFKIIITAFDEQIKTHSSFKM